METKLRTASVQEILATRSRATFNYRVNFETIAYDNLPLMKEWCEQHCSGLWRAESHYALYFQFADEKDATMFMLKWSNAKGNKVA